MLTEHHIITEIILKKKIMLDLFDPFLYIINQD